MHSSVIPQMFKISKATLIYSDTYIHSCGYRAEGEMRSGPVGWEHPEMAPEQ